MLFHLFSSCLCWAPPGQTIELKDVETHEQYEFLLNEIEIMKQLDHPNIARLASGMEGMGGAFTHFALSTHSLAWLEEQSSIHYPICPGGERVLEGRVESSRGGCRRNRGSV